MQRICTLFTTLCLCRMSCSEEIWNMQRSRHTPLCYLRRSGGELVFEPRRFVELRKKPFWQQFLSPESTGMGIFYTLNVFCIQACPSSARAWSDA